MSRFIYFLSSSLNRQPWSGVFRKGTTYNHADYPERRLEFSPSLSRLARLRFPARSKCPCRVLELLASSVIHWHTVRSNYRYHTALVGFVRIRRPSLLISKPLHCEFSVLQNAQVLLTVYENHNGDQYQTAELITMHPRLPWFGIHDGDDNPYILAILPKWPSFASQRSLPTRTAVIHCVIKWHKTFKMNEMIISVHTTLLIRVIDLRKRVAIDCNIAPVRHILHRI